MREQTIIHLANVLAIAEADGTFPATEEAVLRYVMERLGAGAAEVAAARKLLAQKPPYRLLAFPDPAARMAVIEDMVMMSLADGQITPQESRPLEAFIDSLGYVQADMDMIVRRVRTRLSNILPPPPPPPPPPPLATNRFSPRQASIAPASPIPPIPFSACKTPQTSNVLAPPNPPSHAAPDGDELTVEEKSPASSPPPPPWTACAQRRAHAPAEACYCFGAPEGPLNPWGCRLMNMPWADGAFWLRLGRFRDDATFVFDRDAIAARLRQRLATVSTCPFLLPGVAEAALDALPSRATLGERWKPHLVPASAPNASPVTIRTYLHGCCRLRAVLADGLTPTGDHDVQRLIRRAVRRTGAVLDFAMLDNPSEGEHS